LGRDGTGAAVREAHVSIIGARPAPDSPGCGDRSGVSR
jgi:hypothetical protein